MATSSRVRLLELEVCPVWPRVIPSPASPRISRVGNLRSGRWTGATEGAEPQRPQAWELGTHTHCHLGCRQHWEARSRGAQRGRTQPVCPLHGLYQCLSSCQTWCHQPTTLGSTRSQLLVLSRVCGRPWVSVGSVGCVGTTGPGLNLKCAARTLLQGLA